MVVGKINSGTSPRRERLSWHPTLPLSPAVHSFRPLFLSQNHNPGDGCSHISIVTSHLRTLDLSPRPSDQGPALYYDKTPSVQGVDKLRNTFCHSQVCQLPHLHSCNWILRAVEQIRRCTDEYLTSIVSSSCFSLFFSFPTSLHVLPCRHVGATTVSKKTLKAHGAITHKTPAQTTISPVPAPKPTWPPSYKCTFSRTYPLPTTAALTTRFSVVQTGRFLTSKALSVSASLAITPPLDAQVSERSARTQPGITYWPTLRIVKSLWDRQKWLMGAMVWRR